MGDGSWVARACGIRWVLAAACVAIVPACGIDDRQLAISEPPGPLPDADGGGGFDSGIGADVGSIAAGGAGGVDSGSPLPGQRDATPVPIDGGSCVHVDKIGKPDCGDTLVANADFNRDASDWPAADAVGKLTWSTSDSQHAKTSGSLSVKNTYKADLDGPSVAAAGQCVTVTPGATYDFSAEVFIAKGQVYGTAQLAVWFYKEAKCAGLTEVAISVAGSDVTDRWVPVSGSLTTQDSTSSMMVRLVSQKPFREAPLEVLFDAIRVRAR